jgi:ATP-binding cassette subfamily B protein
MSSTFEAYLNRLTPTAPAPSTHGQQAAAGTLLQGLARAGALHAAVGLLVIHALETVLLLGSWACIGSGALSGRLDTGWLWAWALALLCLVPLHAANMWLQATVTTGCGGVLKERLLAGALALPVDTVQSRGSAALMSEVLESEVIEESAAGGGVGALLGLVELLLAPWLYAWAAAGTPQLVVLLVWTVLTVAVFSTALRLRIEWSRQRVALTQRLIENMGAHRTRVAQQAPRYWHRADDPAHARYALLSQRLDRYGAAIQSALPRGYVVVACLALVPAFLSGGASLAQLAISLGGILFTAAAWQRLCTGFSRGAAALAAWRIIRPVLAACAHPASAPRASAPAKRASRMIEVHDLCFWHPSQRNPVLQHVSFDVMHGDRILLEGESGSGKSTLATLLAGGRAATSGYVLCAGLDRQTAGEAAWRSRIALAPQYHENHIVSGTLLFNLLLARPLPHADEDIAQAVAFCEELGLSSLIERMPSGLNQIVGDTGWRLSQGERSRVFLARALLQQAEVLVLDECLAALDPENLRQCLECIMRRAPTLIVIAHP